MARIEFLERVLLWLRHVKGSTFDGLPCRDAVMPRLKDETLSIRTSAEVKALLKEAAEREHRSVASMMEVLILQYAKQHKLRLDK